MQLNFGIAIQLAMTKKRFKSEDLSSISGLSAHQITRFRNSDVSGLKYINVLSKSFDMTPSELVKLGECS